MNLSAQSESLPNTLTQTNWFAYSREAVDPGRVAEEKPAESHTSWQLDGVSGGVNVVWVTYHQLELCI